MFTKSTARYIAKQAYQYRLMTGRNQHEFKSSVAHARIVRELDGRIVVMDADSEVWFAFMPTKAWANL
jgi:hypothetical protein